MSLAKTQKDILEIVAGHNDTLAKTVQHFGKVQEQILKIVSGHNDTLAQTVEHFNQELFRQGQLLDRIAQEVCCNDSGDSGDSVEEILATRAKRGPFPKRLKSS